MRPLSGRMRSADSRSRRWAGVDLHPERTGAGWAAYYRIRVSKRAYNALDAHLWRLAWKWAIFSHPNKPLGRGCV